MVSTQVTLTVKGEGAVTSVRHFNDAVHSRLLFVTQAPALHMFDLRDRKPMWRLPVPVELGYVTSMELCQGMQYPAPCWWGPVACSGFPSLVQAWNEHCVALPTGQAIMPW